MLHDPNRRPPPTRHELVATLRSATIFSHFTDPQGVLATRLGLRAETLSRVLKQLNADGIVSVSSGNIVRIPNRQKLQRFIEQAGKA